MKKALISSAFTFALFVVGCEKSEPGGLPGTSSSFELSKPSETMKPSETKPVKIHIDRKSDFKEPVSFVVTEVPAGLKAEMAAKTADTNTKDVVLNVTAEKNAQPGDYVIKVTGKPEKTGKDTLTDVKIKVEKP
jgi:hypothetical protein